MVLSCNNLFTNSKHNTLMQTKNKVGYLAPEIEVDYIVVEQGIAQSNMEQIGNEYEDIEW